jgi:glycosyltransferase involved in cell wall biosynthesis
VITIHMTTHRRYRSGLLPAAVESVLRQDFTDFEFIICDDASTDGTADYLERIAARDTRVRIVRNVRNVNSVSVSLGRCLLSASLAHEYISWMFDDCILLPGALRQLADSVRASRLPVSFGTTVVRLASGGTLNVGDRSSGEIRDGVATSSILVPNAGILIHRCVFDEVGWYDPSIVLRRSCDWDLFRRIIAAGVPFNTITSVLVEENGALQSDSLRNTFTTTFALMEKYAAARDELGIELDVKSCMVMPVDWIPPGPWSERELILMHVMFLEYYLSVGELSRALVWAERLEPFLARTSLIAGNLKRVGTDAHAGAYCGVVFALAREQLAEGEGIA